MATVREWEKITTEIAEEIKVQSRVEGSKVLTLHLTSRTGHRKRGRSPHLWSRCKRNASRKTGSIKELGIQGRQTIHILISSQKPGVLATKPLGILCV